MIKARAAILRHSGTLEQTTVDIDDPRGDEVLVRTAATGLCHSDLHIIDGTIAVPKPALVGHEIAGVVEAVGPLVRDVAIGDHVVGTLTASCGRCAYCLRSLEYLCPHRAETGRRADEPPRVSVDGEPVLQCALLGGMAELMLVSQRALVSIEKDMPLDLASILGCGVSTGLGTVWNRARLAPGESAAVIGCGGVGLSIIQGAQIAGASPLIAIDPSPERREAALSLGASHALEPADAVAHVQEVTQGLGVDHAFEAVGTAATVQTALEMARLGGAAYNVGVTGPDPIGLSGAIFNVDGKSLIGSRMGATRFRYDIPRQIELYRRGVLNLDALVSTRLQLDKVDEGFEAMRQATGRRAVVIFS